MPDLTIAAAAAPFDRDMDACLATVARLIDEARAAGAGLLVLPEAALGGYVTSAARGRRAAARARSRWPRAAPRHGARRRHDASAWASSRTAATACATTSRPA